VVANEQTASAALLLVLEQFHAKLEINKFNYVLNK
jgi:hypothetical protein